MGVMDVSEWIMSMFLCCGRVYNVGLPLNMQEGAVSSRLSRWGIGPRILVSATACAALGVVATYLWPTFCLIPWLPPSVLLAVGIVLLIIGVPLWLIAMRSVMRAYGSDRLVTTGVFDLVRHPVYSAWIVFNIPAIALLFRSWPVLLAPLVAYAVFKMSIRTEDEYLEQRFGQEYLNYRARVNELIPIPRFRQK